MDEIPALFLINPDGIIELKRIEYTEENVPDIKAILAEALLSEEEIIPDTESDSIDIEDQE